MEIKKIIIALLIVLFIPLSLFLFSDISQYKQIGDTHFYLLPNGIGQESLLYHDGEKEALFFPINHEGLVHDVYWNQQYIIIKCSQQENENWYIIKNIKDYNYPKFDIRHFLNEKDYERAIDSLEISEKCMEHTDGSIPWRLPL